jgi:hypothetical protein
MPLARYSAIEGALRERHKTKNLHHHLGHNRATLGNICEGTRRKDRGLALSLAGSVLAALPTLPVAAGRRRSISGGYRSIAATSPARTVATHATELWNRRAFARSTRRPLSF